ncbi:hypothetical protein D3C73_1088500 [compost metagenome]
MAHARLPDRQPARLAQRRGLCLQRAHRPDRPLRQHPDHPQAGPDRVDLHAAPAGKCGWSAQQFRRRLRCQPCAFQAHQQHLRGQLGAGRSLQPGARRVRQRCIQPAAIPQQRRAGRVVPGRPAGTERALVGACWRASRSRHDRPQRPGQRPAGVLEDLQQHRLARGHGVRGTTVDDPLCAVLAGGGPGQWAVDDQSGQRRVRSGQGQADRDRHEAGFRWGRMDAGGLSHPQDRVAQP